MFRRECTLCGGKLNGNICTECGLDNSKSDTKYHTHGGHQDDDKLTHVHDKSDPFAGKTMTRNQRKEMQTVLDRRKNAKQVAGSYSMTPQKTEKNKGKGIGAKIITVLVIFSLVSSVAGFVFEVISDMSYETYEDIAIPEPYDPYEYITYDLPETGEHYEMILEPGSYKGGVHIPEGSYYVEVVSGSGMLEATNESIGLYVNHWMDEMASEYDDTVSYVDDFRVYAGTRIEVQENVIVAIVTENANLPLYYMLNPNTEPAVLSEKFEAGRDVAPGVYDVECISGSGIFEYYIEREDGYMEYHGILIDEEGQGFPTTYKNVVLPEGTLVEIPDMTVRLVPSEIIESEEYEFYYE